MAHTPGPWAAYSADYQRLHDADLLPIFVVGPEEFHTVCQVRAGSDDDDLPGQTPANARLIAAAPELLAALKVALKQIEDLDGVLNQIGHQIYNWHLNGQPEPVGNFFAENDCGAVEIARAAIAKATGEAA